MSPIEEGASGSVTIRMSSLHGTSFGSIGAPVSGSKGKALIKPHTLGPWEHRIYESARSEGLLKASPAKENTVWGKYKRTAAEQRTHVYRMITLSLAVVLAAMIVIWQVTR